MKPFGECCHGKVPWERILADNNGREVIRHLSARGKNVAFANAMASVLGLNDLPQRIKWNDVKRAMTPAAVRGIHEAVAAFWPDGRDAERVLHEQRAEHAALFVGTYEPEPLMRGITRHSLYSDVILVMDPFRHPFSIRDEFNPVLHPAEHRTNTLIALRLWWQLAPWIDAGVVRVIHTPADFDSDLALSALEAAKLRKDSIPELQAILGEDIDARMADVSELREYFDLSVPNATIESRAREAYPDIAPEELEAMFAELEERREIHPFFVAPFNKDGQSGGFISFGVGANYDIAKLVAARTSAHLVTDQRYRWKEIELDRQASGIDDEKWSAFAKALQNADLRFLNAVSLPMALRLRDEDRLSDLRLFFRRVWNSVSSSDSFSESVSVDLAAELNDRVREAEEGWSAMNQDLFKWFSSEGAVAGAAVISGQVSLLPAALTLAATAAITTAHWAAKRTTFAARHPAAFFVGLE